MNPLRKFVIGGVVAGTALMGGAVGASLLGTAGAATTDSSTTAPAASSSDTSADVADSPHQANGTTETPLAGTELDQATAVVQAAAPGATIERVETDADGAAFEAHMTQADGTDATVKMDSSFNVTGIETETGHDGGGHGGHGGPHEANGITETPLTGTELDQATAAVQGAAPGATVERVETDADGAAFEAHITQADGTEATVKMDSSFNVTGIENGK